MPSEALLRRLLRVAVLALPCRGTIARSRHTARSKRTRTRTRKRRQKAPGLQGFRRNPCRDSD